jgi:hypothetical protein
MVSTDVEVLFLEVDQALVTSDTESIGKVKDIPSGITSSFGLKGR